MTQVLSDLSAYATSPDRLCATLARRLAIHCLLLLLAATGCSKLPNSQHVTEALLSSPPHLLPVTERSVTLISITADGKNKEQWKVEFECEEIPGADWLAATNADSQIDQSLKRQADAAKERLALLRSPENAIPLERQQAIDRFRFPPLYIPVCRTGKAVRWRGTGLLTRHDDDYQLTLDNIHFPDEIAVKKLQTQAQLDATAVIVDGGDDDPVRLYNSLLKEITTGVSEAEAAMQLRLNREQEILTAVIASQAGLSGIWPSSRQNSEVSVQLHFDTREGDEFLSAVAIDREDPFSRAVFRATLTLPKTTDRMQLSSRAIHDGWILSLENADRKLSAFAEKTPVRMYVYANAANGVLLLADHNRSSALQPNAEKRPSMSTLSAFTREGMQFNGRETPPGRAGRIITMSVTRFDPESGLIRVVAEDAEYPFAFSIFEGRYLTEHPHHLGLPLRLKHIEVSPMPYQPQPLSPLFPDRTYGDLVLLPSETGFHATINGSRLKLDSGMFNKNITDASKRWPSSLAAGSQWKGRLKMGDDPAEPVTMRVAEMRHGGEYVRLLMEKDSNSRQFVVYEGAVVPPGPRVDGYGLVTTQQGSATHFDRHGSGVFFSLSSKQSSPWFRLSPDGNKLYGKCSYGETMVLTRDETVSASIRLSTPEFIKAWETAFVVGKTWKGKIVNPDLRQTGEIQMQVREFENSGERVTVEISAGGRRSSIATYEGTLNSSDATVNGFGMILKKLRGSRGESTVLGAGNIGSELQFRLTPDLNQLIGRTTGQVPFEYIELNAETK